MQTKNRVILVLSLAFIALVALALPDNFIYQYIRIDKIGHFVSFFILAWLVHFLFKLPLPVTCICLVFYGGLTELTQFYLGFRNGEVNDFIADAVGVITFCLVTGLVKLLQKEHIFDKR